MFNLLANFIHAWNQAGLLLGGAIFGGLGAALLASQLHWRLYAQRVTGTIIGVRPSGTGTYFPVYRYCLPDGTSAEATADTGSSATSAMTSGRSVRLMVFANHPGTASDANSYLGEIIGTILTAFGATLFYVSLTAWPITYMTWLMVAVILLYGGTRFHKVFPRPGQKPPGPAWRRSTQEAVLARPVQPIEDLAAAAGTPLPRPPNRLVGPLLAIVGVALVAIAVHLGQTTYRLQSTGQRAGGTVIGLDTRRSSDGTAYYPVVRFVTARGVSREFRDDIGSNPPSFRAGDPVRVLYLERDAALDRAIIDRGARNWIAPGAVLAFGLALVTFGAGLMRRRIRLQPKES